MFLRYGHLPCSKGSIKYLIALHPSRAGFSREISVLDLPGGLTAVGILQHSKDSKETPGNDATVAAQDVQFFGLTFEHRVCKKTGYK
jgi:hypothetical protein